MNKYTFKDIEKQFGISERKLGFLVRKNIIDPIIDGGKLFIPEDELSK